jgi:hypothetical protein
VVVEEDLGLDLAGILGAVDLHNLALALDHRNHLVQVREGSRVEAVGSEIQEVDAPRRALNWNAVGEGEVVVDHSVLVQVRGVGVD